MALPPLKLAHKITPRSNKLRNIKEGPGRVEKIRKTLNALFQYERIELNRGRGAEVRDHAERLIQDAIIYGPNHARTMEIAEFWLTDNHLVHKLFKVIAPRLRDEQQGFTKIWTLADPPKDLKSKAPSVHYIFDWIAVEIKKNPLPPIKPAATPHRHLFLPNVLLSSAAYAEKAKKAAETQENKE